MPNAYSDPPATWDDIITNRCIYFEFIEDKYYTELNSFGGDSMDASSSIYIANREENESTRQKVLNKIKKSKVWMRIKFAQAAQIQGNYKLALGKLQQTRNVIKSGQQQQHQSRLLADLQLTWMHCYLNTHLARAKMVNSPDEMLNMFFGAIVLKEIVKYDSSEEFTRHRELLQDHCLLHASFCRFLIDSFLNLANSTADMSFYAKLNADDKKRNQLMDYIKTDDVSNIEDVKETFFDLLSER